MSKMLTIKEATHRGNVVSVFHLTPGEGLLQDTLSQVKAKLDDRFRCGEDPRAGHSPLLGRVAFIHTNEVELHPAALVALSHGLADLFDVICVQDGPEHYVVSVVSERTKLSYSLGECIPIGDVKEHRDPWAVAGGA
jgi:hypothetical protein